MSSGTDSSSISPDNLWVLENLYEQFKQDPASLPPDWIKFFRDFDNGAGGVNGANGSGGASRLYIPKLSSEESEAVTDINLKAMLLAQAYRRQGHYSAKLDPLGITKPTRYNLDPATHGLQPEDLNKEVTTLIAGKMTNVRLSDMVDRMEKTYCSSIAADFFYIRDEERRGWLVNRMESEANQWALKRDTRKFIYEKLCRAEQFERFLATRYIGKKRFSLEGSESLIPAIAAAVEQSGSYEIKQMILGMAHRGRLNVLYNILGKDPALIFAEFNENVPEDVLTGDVKYHLGYSSDAETMSGNHVHLSLAFNPSHLEVINPVVMGSVRARQTKAQDIERSQFLPLVVHGDAAFSGQGINYECLNMSRLPGYFVGGTFHIICNNQIGFTTTPEDSRTTHYCTDVAKMLQVPIFHVNADDPEAVWRAVQLCMEWRQRYKTDVFLDLICYRRLGHNENDEPAFTQPEMYKIIKKHPTTLALFEKQLLSQDFEQKELDEVKQAGQLQLEEAYDKVQTQKLLIQSETLRGNWTGFRKINPFSNPDTGVAESILKEITNVVTSVPANFKPHNKIKRLLDQRRAMIEPGGRIDWGMGEMLTYGTLLDEGTPIRFSGQDVKRGTFSHRHAALFDVENGSEYVPLQNIKEGQASFELFNTLLSEVATLGFEFGYSLAEPRSLVIWEAQFGDFANGAQVIVDQFISSSAAKWNRMSGLVMLLPHGYEGQGPEHSSARLERYLQLCSQNNIQVCNCTTPAQYFHLLRRQMHRNFRMPLVLMSPKSLLRLPQASSTLDEYAKGKFHEVLGETNERVKPEAVKRVLLCSGKIYYELLAARDQAKSFDIAIVRLEQMYPFPAESLGKVLKKYPGAKDVQWVQEEPRNQGAWIYLEHWLYPLLTRDQRLDYVGRAPSPSPATGYFKVHQREQKQILDEALT